MPRAKMRSSARGPAATRRSVAADNTNHRGKRSRACRTELSIAGTWTEQLYWLVGRVCAWPGQFVLTIWQKESEAKARFRKTDYVCKSATAAPSLTLSPEKGGGERTARVASRPVSLVLKQSLARFCLNSIHALSDYMLRKLNGTGKGSVCVGNSVHTLLLGARCL
jgi:hypothetical protein